MLILQNRLAPSRLLSVQSDLLKRIHEKPELLINQVCNIYTVVEVFAY